MKHSHLQYNKFNPNTTAQSPVFNTLQRIGTNHKIGKRSATREELICCLMGKVGFSGRFISNKTGLDLRYVYKTLKKVNIRLWDFRNGRTQWGRAVGNTCVERIVGDTKLLKHEND